MKGYTFITVFIFLMLIPSIACTEQYLCVAEHVAGFKYNKSMKEWKGTLFLPNEKFIVSECKGDFSEEFILAKCSYKVTKVGTKAPSCECRKGFNIANVLICECMGGEFKFNKRTGRYLYSYLFGYWNDSEDSKEGNNTPYIEIGRCSPF